MMMPMVVNFRYNETTGREGFVVHNKQLPCDDEFAFMVKVVVDHHPVHPQPQHLTQPGLWSVREVFKHQLESSILRQHHAGELLLLNPYAVKLSPTQLQTSSSSFFPLRDRFQVSTLPPPTSAKYSNL